MQRHSTAENRRDVLCRRGDVQWKHSYLDDACEAIHSARQLTGQLLTFAKGSAPVLARVDLTTLIRDTVSFNLRGSNVDPELFPADGLWRVTADRGQIEQVLSNLIFNARQGMPQGGPLSKGPGLDVISEVRLHLSHSYP